MRELTVHLLKTEAKAFGKGVGTPGEIPLMG